MTLKAKLEKIRDRLTPEHFSSEAEVRQGIVLPILRELNWDTDNTRVVWPEYKVGDGWADFALCGDNGDPKVFIEVKKEGLGIKKKKRKAVEQAMIYDSRVNVDIVVLTDGGIWSFYLPEVAGRFSEKRVFELDIWGHTPQESSEVLQRYLEERRVVEGDALETARVNFFLENNRKSGLQWENMVNDAIAIFSATHVFLAQRLPHQMNPTPAQANIEHGIVDHFHSLIRKNISQSSSRTTAPRTQPESGGQVSTPSGPKPTPGRAPNVRIKELVILGRSCPCRNQKEALANIFKTLQEEDPGFLQRFYNDPRNHQPGGGRWYLGRNQQELDGWSIVQIGRDWFIPTGYSWLNKKEIIQLAADVAGLKLKFEEDISGKSVIVILAR